MVRPRKTLGSPDSPYIVSLTRLMATQSKTTLATWCVDYAEAHLVPLFLKRCPGDGRPLAALNAARDWLAGRVKLPVVKRIILDECHAAARALDADPAAQAAARACGHAAACCHTPRHALGIAFYGAAAIAYDRVGTGETPAVYEQIAAEACADMEAALRAVSVENEPHPANLG